MGQIVHSDSFTTAIDLDVWNKDLGSVGSADYAIAVVSSELEFDRGADAGMRSGFLTLKKAMASPDYSVTVKAKLKSGQTGAILIGLRGAGPDDNDADRAGYYVYVSFVETGQKEGGAGHSAFDERVYFHNIGTGFNWDSASIISLNVGEGAARASGISADLTTTPGTYITMTFSVTGDTLEFWADGVLIARAVDTSLTNAGHVRIGVQGDDATDSFSLFDDFEVFLLEGSGMSGNAASYAHVGFDEARNDVVISVPTAGADTPRQFVYDITHDEWYKRDQSIRSFGFALDTVGEHQLIFGDSNGYVNVFNATNNWTDDSTTFTGTWTSNWIDIGSKQERKTIEKLIVDVAKATANTAMVVTLETRDHPDGYPRTRRGTVHLTNLRTPILTRLGGRYVRITVEHTAEGDVEIERILAVVAGAKLDKVHAR